MYKTVPMFKKIILCYSLCSSLIEEYIIIILIIIINQMINIIETLLIITLPFREL